MIVALLGIGLTLFLTLISATWYLSAKLSKIEARLDNRITETICNERREKLSKTIDEEIARHENHHHETSLVRRRI